MKRPLGAIRLVADRALVMTRCLRLSASRRLREEPCDAHRTSRNSKTVLSTVNSGPPTPTGSPAWRPDRNPSPCQCWCSLDSSASPPTHRFSIRHRPLARRLPSSRRSWNGRRRASWAPGPTTSRSSRTCAEIPRQPGSWWRTPNTRRWPSSTGARSCPPTPTSADSRGSAGAIRSGDRRHRAAAGIQSTTSVPPFVIPARRRLRESPRAVRLSGPGRIIWGLTV